MNEVLKITDVTRSYPGSPPVEALKGIDLAIDEGEMAAVVGPSGSGKSTLLNIIGTLDRPTSGSLSIEGVDTATLSDRQLSGLRAARLGFVFQSFHLLETVSVLDNVATGLLYQGQSAAQRRQEASRALDLVGLSEKAQTRPTKLSGGQRQRVAIARAIVGEPALVLADEPTGNLDSVTGGGIVELLHNLNAQGATIVVVTHDHAMAGEMPRRIALCDGLVESDARVAGDSV